MITTTSPRIAVIGAGLCGSFLSYLLQTKGFSDIVLFEKKSLADSHLLGKVCGGCLHREAVKILARHGLTDTIQPGTEIKTVSLISSECRISFHYNHGPWINRRLLDNAIRVAAQNKGVIIVHQQAKITNWQEGTIHFDGKEEKFDVIIDCGGIGGKALPEWPTQQIENSGFGFHGYLKNIDAKKGDLGNLELGEVRFYIDDSGYHGVVKVAGEDPYFHVASYLYGKKLETSPFLKKYFLLEDLHEKSATETLYRKRLPAQGRVFLCGDALGYPEPFTGEGMYFAIQTAEKLAEMITSEFQQHEKLSENVTVLWKEEIELLQKKQWARCQMATWFIKNSFKRKILFPLIPYVAPLASKIW